MTRDWQCREERSPNAGPGLQFFSLNQTARVVQKLQPRPGEDYIFITLNHISDFPFATSKSQFKGHPVLLNFFLDLQIPVWGSSPGSGLFTQKLKNAHITRKKYLKIVTKYNYVKKLSPSPQNLW